MVKILVVEDGELVWKNMLRDLVQRHGVARESIERARWYTEAQEKIGSCRYDIIFLDHNMPYTDPGTDDEQKIYDLIRPVGYQLLPFIREKQPQAKVVGTSSCSDASGSFDCFYDKTARSPQLPPMIEELLS